MTAQQIRRLKGARLLPSGRVQVNVQVPDGAGGRRFCSTTFPGTVTEDTVRAWQAAELQKHGLGAAAPAAGSLGADITAYLERVAAMPTIKQRTAHLALWAQALGRDRARDSVTPAEIDAVCQGWQLAAPAPKQPGRRGRRAGPHGLNAQTIRKRRTSLQSFYRMLNGKHGYNPARDAAPIPQPRSLEIRGLDFPTIVRILAAMPDRLSAKPGADHGPSLAKIRARVIAYTGIPPAVLMRVQPSDLQWKAGTIRLQRRKGKGIVPRTIPLMAEGLEALRAFEAADAFGPFAVQSVNRAFQKACRRLDLPAGIRLYDLRHSFLTLAYQVRGDQATVARLGLHAEGSPMTARYTRAANEAVDRAAADAMSAALLQLRRDAIAEAPRKA